MSRAKLHPEDAMLAELIASAASFTAHLRVGPHEKYTVRCASYGEALEQCRALEAAHSRFGRRALVYAVTPKGLTVHCSADLAQLAGVA